MTLPLTKKHSFDTVFDSQKVFRLILKAVSNPARVVNIKENADKLYCDYSIFLTIGLTLMDNEISFNTCENGALSDEIISLTLARREKLDSADFVFISDVGDIKNLTENVIEDGIKNVIENEAEDVIENETEGVIKNVTENVIEDVIENVKCGTLAEPHKSATVVIQNGGVPDCRLTLTGPGIDGQTTIQATQTVKTAITLRDAQNYEYPQGIDLIFISNDGGLFAIPRLVKVV